MVLNNFARTNVYKNIEPITSEKYRGLKNGQTSLIEDFKSGTFLRNVEAGRLFGLDVGDWSMLFPGLTIAGLLVAAA